MNSDHFKVVFNVLDNTLADHAFTLTGLLLTVVGLLIIFFPKIFFRRKTPTQETKSVSLVFGLIFTGFAVLWTMSTCTSTRERQTHFQNLVTEQKCVMVEGYVERFVPMPYNGHAFESFEVSGVHFIYSEFMITGAFNHTLSHGGPIGSGTYVRICYDPDGNKILKLEVRDR